MAKEFEALLSEHDPGVREIAAALRKTVAALVPIAKEKVHPGWKVVGYSFGGGMKAQFCALGPQSSYVNVYLMNGADLEDPEGLLEGKGKGMRHVKVRSVKDAASPALKALIRQAAALKAEG